MRVLGSTLGLAVSAALLLAPAEARGLSVVSVTPQGVACVFNKSCAVTPTDSYGIVRLFGNGGEGMLLTRTYPGLPGTPAAGLTGYSFHLDLRDTTALGTANCVEKLVVDAGPLAPLPYARGSAEVFVVAGEGSAAVSSVTQTGPKVTFVFAKPICPMVPGSARRGIADSLYFGFAAKGSPVPSKAQVVGSMGEATVDVRVPKH